MSTRQIASCSRLLKFVRRALQLILGAFLGRFVIGSLFLHPLNGECQLVPMSQMLHPIDDILLAYCGSCCTLMPITTILFLVSGTICCIVTTRALSIIMFCDSIYFLSLCISTMYFTIGMYSYWLLTMLSIIAVAFGVHILLPLMVYSLADTFGVHILLPLMVYTLANTFGVYILLPLMCTL